MSGNDADKVQGTGSVPDFQAKQLQPNAGGSLPQSRPSDPVPIQATARSAPPSRFSFSLSSFSSSPPSPTAQAPQDPHINNLSVTVPFSFSFPSFPSASFSVSPAPIPSPSKQKDGFSLRESATSPSAKPPTPPAEASSSPARPSSSFSDFSSALASKIKSQRVPSFRNPLRRSPSPSDERSSPSSSRSAPESTRPTVGTEVQDSVDNPSPDRLTSSNVAETVAQDRLAASSTLPNTQREEAEHAECREAEGGRKDAGPSPRVPQNPAIIAQGLASLLGPAMRECDQRVEGAVKSQEKLAEAVDRLTKGLDKLLEDTPLPLAAAQAARLTGVRKRLHSMQATLCIVQARIDHMNAVITQKTAQPSPRLSPTALLAATLPSFLTSSKAPTLEHTNSTPAGTSSFSVPTTPAHRHSSSEPAVQPERGPSRSAPCSPLLTGDAGEGISFEAGELEAEMRASSAREGCRSKSAELTTKQAATQGETSSDPASQKGQEVSNERDEGAGVSQAEVTIPNDGASVQLPAELEGSVRDMGQAPAERDMEEGLLDSRPASTAPV